MEFNPREIANIKLVDLAELTGPGVEEIGEEKMERALALEQATLRLENFMIENNFEALSYIDQAQKLKQFLDKIVEDLQDMTALASSEKSDKDERYVLRQQIEVVAKKLHELHQVVNFMNEVDEPERFLIS